MTNNKQTSNKNRRNNRKNEQKTTSSSNSSGRNLPNPTSSQQPSQQQKELEKMSNLTSEREIIQETFKEPVVFIDNTGGPSKDTSLSSSSPSVIRNDNTSEAVSSGSANTENQSNSGTDPMKIDQPDKETINDQQPQKRGEDPLILDGNRSTVIFNVENVSVSLNEKC